MVDKKNIKNIYALSPMQEGMLMHTVYGDSPLAYFEQTRYRITGDLDLAIFTDTWQLIVQRHDIFRTIFVYENVPKPIQIVLKERLMPIELLDFTSYEPEIIKVKVEEEVLIDRSKPFHLTKDNLMRMKIIKVAPQMFEIIWSSHHILMDGWSLGLVLQEFFEIYQSKLKKISPKLKTPIAYGDYIKFLKTIDAKTSLQFWKDYLKDYHKQMRIPCALAASNQEYSAGEYNFSVDSRTTKKLSSLAQENQMTVSSVVQSLWSLVLWQLNSLENPNIDVVFGVTVSGRPADVRGVSDIVGLFINTVPCRFKGNTDQPLMAFIKNCHQSLSETKSFHYSSLAEIQNESLLKQKLFDHIFVFENYPISADEETGKEIGLTIDNFTHFDFTNYGFTLQVAPSEALGFKFLYNKKLYGIEIIEWLQKRLLELIQCFVATPNDSITSILYKLNDSARALNTKIKADQPVLITNGLLHQLPYVTGSIFDLKNNAKDATGGVGYYTSQTFEKFDKLDKYKQMLERVGLLKSEFNNGVLISANFTSEPIEASLQWWLRQFQITKPIYFAPYNQIHQQCLDNQSLFSKNKGENIVLLRIVDWLRDLEELNQESVRIALLSNLEILNEAFIKRHGSAKLILFVLPYDKQNFGNEINSLIDSFTHELVSKIEMIAGISVFSLENEFSFYQISNIFDHKQDEIGHIPYTQEAFHCLGTMVARKLVSYQKPGFKVIVVDCDNTLWNGVVGELGADNVRVEEPYQLLQQFLLSKYEAGFLLAMSSKNNEADVFEVFKKNKGMILRPEHFASYRINWEPKSQNIKSIAKELNLGLNSFIFIDDSVMEIAEVMENCPETFSLTFPENGKNIRHLLYHSWVFDQFRITEEDLQRNEMMKAENKRNQAIVENGSLEGFLKGLQLKIGIYELNEKTPADIWSRASQLTFRTNQFNLNTKRRTEQELISLIKFQKNKIWIIQVEDRFGQYGWVGLIICVPGEQSYQIDTMLLSCRVLGRGVEFVLLEQITKAAVIHDKKKISLEYKASEKNKPIKEFLDKITWSFQNESDNKTFYELFVPAEINPYKDVTLKIIETLPDSKIATPVTKFDNSSAIKINNDEINLSTAIEFNIEVFNKEKLEHISYYQPIFHHDAVKISKLPLYETKYRKLQNVFVKPNSPDEKTMAKIWSELLVINEVGTADNFFELGGHSLLATRLLSRISQVFSKDLSLKEFYDHPQINSLLDYMGKHSKIAGTIEKTNTAAYYPLSYSQKRLWALQNLDEKSFAYNTPNNYVITGTLHIDALKGSFEELFKRHEALRTRIVLIDGKPFQKVMPPNIDFFKMITLNEGQIEEYLRVENERYFDLEKDTLFRVIVIKVLPSRHILHINMHHIISDGWSMEIIEKEILQMYGAAVRSVANPVKPINYQYKDYSQWHNDIINSDNNKTLKEFWLQKLSGDLPDLNFPLDFKRPAIQTHRGKILGHTFSEFQSRLVKEISQKMSCGYFPVLQALLNLLLNKYTSQKDILIGAPVSGRNRPEFHDTIGFFVNTIVLRNLIDTESNFQTLISQIQKSFAEAYDHQLYPFDLLVENLGLERDFSRSPIFDVFTSYQKMEATPEDNQLLEIQNYPIAIEISRFDLMFHFQEQAGKFSLDITYNTDLFKDSTIKRLFIHFGNLLESAVINSEKPVKYLTLLGAEEQKCLFEMGRIDHYQKNAIRNETITGVFSKIARSSKKAVAVLEGSKNLTYEDLDNQSNNLAGLLINQGVKKGEIVACLIPKSKELLISLLAIMKTGAIYLPLDVNLPNHRIEFILNDSQSKVCLVVDDSIKINSTKRLFLNVNEMLNTRFSHAPVDEAKPSDIAYMIYTSGSTGLPKGTLLKHEGFVNMCLDQIRLFSVDSKDRVLWFASPSFDASLSEIFMTLLCGATLVIPEKEDISDTLNFENLLETKSITIITLPPVYLHQLKKSSLDKIKTLITAGEPPIIEDVKQLSEKLNYFNAYGPTETSVCATAYKVEAGFLKSKNEIPIGSPIAGLGIVLLNENREIVPMGLKGEIAIAGIGLAHSYWNKPELTAEKFVFLKEINDRVYLTGDNGYWDENSQLVFMGRKDDQVKIRGHRIELHEINAVILSLGITEEVETLVFKEKNNSRLISFLLKSKIVQPEIIKQKLVEFLPSYMIPHDFVFLNEYPTTNSGKIDKEKLIKNYLPGLSNLQKVLPVTMQEKDLFEQLRLVLKSNDFGIEDSFFDLGGDSIRAIEYVSRLRKIGYQLSTKQIFLNPTIKQLASTLPGKTDVIGKSKEIYEGPVKLSPIQAWFFDTFTKESHHFNHSEIFICKEKIEENQLRQIVLQLGKNHEILRAICKNNALHILKDSPEGTYKIFENLNWEEYLQLLKKEQQSIDLQNGPLWKIILFRLKEGDRLLFCFHHLVIDGVSWRIIFEEFLQLLHGSKDHSGLELSESAGFHHWTEKVHQFSQSREIKNEVAYWDQFANPLYSQLPGVVDHSSLTVNETKAVKVSFSERETENILKVMLSKFQCNINELLLSTLAIALSNFRKTPDTLIMMEGHGRNDILSGDLDISRTVGWFTNAFPFLLKCSSTNLEEQIKEIQNQFLLLPNHGLGYGILKYISNNYSADITLDKFKPKVSFNFLGHYEGVDDSSILELDKLSPDYSVSSQSPLLYSLNINGIIQSKRLEFYFSYHEFEYSYAVIRDIAEDFKNNIVKVLIN